MRKPLDDAQRALVGRHLDLIEEVADGRYRDHGKKILDLADMRGAAALALCRAAANFDGDAGDDAWFRSYARQCCHHGIRVLLDQKFRRCWRRRVPEMRPIGPHRDFVDTRIEEPGAALERADDLDALHRAVDRLPDLERAVIRRRLAGALDRETAAELGHSREWIRLVRKRAEQFLREMMVDDDAD